MEDAAELIEQIKKSGTQRPNPCRHTMPGGTRCGSPACAEKNFASTTTPKEIPPPISVSAAPVRAPSPYRLPTRAPQFRTR